MLWQQKYFSSDLFRAPSAPSASMGQVCRKQPDGTWSCPKEEEEQPVQQPTTQETTIEEVEQEAIEVWAAPEAESGYEFPPPPVSQAEKAVTPSRSLLLPIAVGGAVVIATVLLLNK